MLNKVVLVGRLTKDPQKVEKEEMQKVIFSIAVERPYKNQNGEYATDFIFCKAFGKLAQHIVKYTHQGMLVALTGHMQSYKYEKASQTHFVTELCVETIKFLSTLKDSPQSHNEHNAIMEDFGIMHRVDTEDTVILD